MTQADRRVTRTLASVRSVAGRLLLDKGWDQVTHAHVALASGYSRATLYKHWPKPVDLLRAAFLHVGGFSHGELTGNLRDDLVSEMEAFRRVLIDEKLAVALVALADRSAADPEIGSIRDQFLGEGQVLLSQLIEAGLRSRDVRAEVLPGPAVDMLSGALVYRIAILGAAVDRAYVEAIVDTFLRGVIAPGRSDSS